jgi:hypothetical protein
MNYVLSSGALLGLRLLIRDSMSFLIQGKGNWQKYSTRHRFYNNKLLGHLISESDRGNQYSFMFPEKERREDRSTATSRRCISENGLEARVKVIISEISVGQFYQAAQRYVIYSNGSLAVTKMCVDHRRPCNINVHHERCALYEKKACQLVDGDR